MRTLLALLLSSALAWGGVQSQASGSDGLVVSNTATDLGSTWTVNFFEAVTNPNLPFGVAPFFARTTYNGSGDPTCGELLVTGSPGGAGSHIAVDLSFHTAGAPNGLTGVPFPLIQSVFTIADTSYHQVTVTHTALGLFSLYIDSAFDSSVTNATAPYSGCEFTMFFDRAAQGIQACGQTSGATGFCTLAEVSAFRSILTLAQIKALRSTPASLLGPQPIYYYPLYFNAAHGDFGGGVFDWHPPSTNPETVNHIPVGMPTGEGH